MKILYKVFLLLSIVYAIGVVGYIAFSEQNEAKAATNHVVISQIQTTGVTANDEFVELYNPTDATINLAGWRLDRKSGTTTATQSADILVASMSGSLAPRRYFLITSNEAIPSPSADLKYSNTSNHIASNNSVILYNDAGITNPATNGSVLRKASATSTAQTLSTGGTEVSFGNGFDTDNNATQCSKSTSTTNSH